MPGAPFAVHDVKLFLKLFLWFLGLPVAIVAVVFAVSNRNWVTFDLWPLPYQIDAPLFVAVFVGVLTGFLFGATVAWYSGRKRRRLARSFAQETTRLHRELLKNQPDSRETAPGAESGTAQRLARVENE